MRVPVLWGRQAGLRPVGEPGPVLWGRQAGLRPVGEPGPVGVPNELGVIDLVPNRRRVTNGAKAGVESFEC
jgi:hypothetical protein